MCYFKDWVLRNFNPAKMRNYSPVITALIKATINGELHGYFVAGSKSLNFELCRNPRR